MLFVSQTLVNIFRDWVMLHINGRFQIKVVSDFLFKMLKLTVSFFDIRNKGEHLQRITDHKRIQSFVSSQDIYEK